MMREATLATSLVIDFLGFLERQAIHSRMSAARLTSSRALCSSPTRVSPPDSWNGCGRSPWN